MQENNDNLILVTGALGWLGKRMIKLIFNRQYGNELLDGPLNGHTRVRCLILPGQDEHELLRISDRITVFKGDIRNPADCDAFTKGAEGSVLIHIAGVIHPGKVKDFYGINLDGTRNLLAAAQAHRVSRIVIMSSNSPCGCNPFRDHLFDEESPYHPYMNYGRSKMLMEGEVKKAQAGGAIETVIIRAPWFYGPDQPDRQTLFFTMIRQGKGPIVGNGENLRSMAYLDNLSQGLLLGAFQPQANGQIYWIADDRPYSMNEIIDTIEYLLEKEFNYPVAHKRMKLPGIAGEVAEIVDSILQKAGIYQQKIHVLGEMNKTIACSVEKAKSHLGYKPMVSLEEGMRRSIRSVIENGQKI
jgi:nucleoside-diphosphate-sugar epimerase